MPRPFEMVNDLVSKSSQSWSRYMTEKGLTEHIGTYSSYFHLYIAKEDLDNAADYLENTYMDANVERVIALWVHTNDSTLTFTVRNSNPNSEPTAFQTHIKDIFNYDYFLSTKKNKFRIGRGAIGDANKPKLSIPYAILHENGVIINGMAAPLTIKYNDQLSKISLDTSKFITNKLEAIIKTEPRPLNEKPHTEVQLKIPTAHLSYDFVNQLKEYCLNYSIFSTHITFFFDINGEKITTPNDTIVSNTWTNQITAWAYTDNEFLVFIESLVNQSISVSTALTGFRELKWLPKEWAQKILSELSAEEKTGLLTELKDHSRPMKELSVPYGGNKESDDLRRAALIKRIAAIYEVDELLAEYKVVRARYESPDGEVNFPYVFEIIAIPFNDIWNKKEEIFIGAVNNSVSIINRGKSLYDGMFTFKDKGKEHTAWNMEGILSRWYGWDLRDSKKSWPCVIAVNLLTPKVHWREQGKSTLVIEPFADTIVETVTKVMKKIPTFHGMGVGQSSKSKKPEEPDKPKKLDKIGCLRKFLEDRYTQFEIASNTIDPDIMKKDRTSQSDTYYTIRQTLFAENDIVEDKGTRRYITGRINAECKALFRRHGEPGKKREDLGITAGHRAELYYMGTNMNISLENVKPLAKYGTDAIFIEKEDGVILLDEPASMFGFALINTHGHMTEYGKEFVKAFTEENVSAVSFTDLDAAGVAIAAGAGRGIPRIGVTDEMLEYFGLERKDVDEEYTPTKSQITRAKELAEKYQLGLRHKFKGIRRYEDKDTGEIIEEEYADYEDYKYVYDELDYILGPEHDGRHARRIEINSVKAKLKTKLGLAKYKEEFSGYVKKKLLEFAPTRDYKRVISSLPNLEHRYPDAIRRLSDYVNSHVLNITRDERIKIDEELTDVNDFIKVKDKRMEIEERLGKIVSEDEHLKEIADSLEEFMRSKGYGDSV
jgi:hypothetical protein